MSQSIRTPATVCTSPIRVFVSGMLPVDFKTHRDLDRTLIRMSERMLCLGVVPIMPPSLEHYLSLHALPEKDLWRSVLRQYLELCQVVLVYNKHDSCSQGEIREAMIQGKTVCYNWNELEAFLQVDAGEVPDKDKCPVCKGARLLPLSKDPVVVGVGPCFSCNGTGKSKSLSLLG